MCSHTRSIKTAPPSITISCVHLWTAALSLQEVKSTYVMLTYEIRQWILSADLQSSCPQKVSAPVSHQSLSHQFRRRYSLLRRSHCAHSLPSALHDVARQHPTLCDEDYLCLHRHTHTDTVVAIWRSGNALVSINEVNLRRGRLVLGWWPCPGLTSGSDTLFRYVTPKSTQPSIIRGMVKWVPAKGRWCSAVRE